jgi:hypothetical protein
MVVTETFWWRASCSQPWATSDPADMDSTPTAAAPARLRFSTLVCPQHLEMSL